MRVSHLSRASLSDVLRRALRTSRAPLALLSLLCLTLAGCGQGGGPSPTASVQPTATSKPTTCEEVKGIGAAQPLNLPAMQFPPGTVARPLSPDGGGPGQYTVASYLACSPNTDANLTMSTGKGPESFTSLLLLYAWAPWSSFPTNGDKQGPCMGTCFAYNGDIVSKGLFSPAPNFLQISPVASIGNGLQLFNLRVTTPPVAPTCDPGYDTLDDEVFGHHPEYQTYYDVVGGIQYPPLTRLVGDSSPGTIGESLCSAGTPASIKAFMDQQFSTHGYTATSCGANDCWQNSATTVTMSFPSATQWSMSTPR